MGRLIYSAIASLDGYVEDASGAFDWAAPDEEMFAFVNEHERPIGTFLMGRRMYDTMTYWETAADEPDQAAPEIDFTQLWLAADKIVYSRTLAAPTTARTRIAPSFDPDDVAQLKESATGDLSIGGAELAGQALAAGLVDECQVYLHPIAVGGGKPVFPLGVRVRLDLVEQHRFTNGAIWLRYAIPAAR